MPGPVRKRFLITLPEWELVAEFVNSSDAARHWSRQHGVTRPEWDRVHVMDCQTCGQRESYLLCYHCEAAAYCSIRCKQADRHGPQECAEQLIRGLGLTPSQNREIRRAMYDFEWGLMKTPLGDPVGSRKQALRIAVARSVSDRNPA